MTEKTPETLRARAELLRTDLGAGLTSLAVVLDGHASAWAADRKRIEALEKQQEWRTDEPPDEMVLVTLAQDSASEKKRVWIGVKEYENWYDPEGFPLRVEAWMRFPAALRGE